MPSYKAPLRDQQFVLHELLGVVDELNALPRYAELDAHTINHVVEEAGKFCEDVLLPTNRPGDEEGCTYDPAAKSVRTPTGFKAAYDARDYRTIVTVAAKLPDAVLQEDEKLLMYYDVASMRIEEE